MSARASNKTAFSVPPGLVLPARSLLALALAAVFVWQLTKETNKYSEGKTTTTFTDEKVIVCMRDDDDSESFVYG